MRSVIVATGSHIPSVAVPNELFLNHEFHGPDQKPIQKSNAEILKQFEAITGIRERRYVPDDLVTSDMAFDAARQALQSSSIDRETLDYIIVAHNFGDVRAGSLRSDLVPALAARVKNKLEIENPRTVAVDVIFGCPGWLQGVIWADSMIRAGDVKRVMVIGADTLSRISDPHDRDSLIYADGAGATILEARDTKDGILAHAVRSDTLEHSTMLRMGHSYKDETFLEALFLKMEGRKANGKMDEAILEALYELYGIKDPPHDVMPMTISTLGNSSVATIPTMLDLICKGKLRGHALAAGDIVVFASVGAGMHINAVVYRVPPSTGTRSQ